MVPEDRAHLRASQAFPVYDRIIERGVQFLLIFTLAAFGTVQTWSIAVMEITSFIIFGVCLLKMNRQGEIKINRSPLINLWLTLIGVILLQLVPLPIDFLRTISPSTVELLAISGVAEKGSWHSLSLYPHITKDELYKILAYFSVFVVIIHHYRTKEQIGRVVNTIIVLGCGLVIFAIIQKLTWNGKMYWFYPLSPGIKSDLNHIWGPYINRNHFAGYLEMAVPLAIGMLLYQLARRATHGNLSPGRAIMAAVSSQRISRLIFIALAVIVMVAGVFMCVSRGGILGFTVSSLFLVMMARSRRTLRKQTFLLLAIGLIIVLAVVVAAWGGIAGRFEQLADSDGVARYHVWKDALGIVIDYPVFGTGAGTFSIVFPRYQTRYSAVSFEHAENDYIEVMTDLGISGLVICLAMIIVFFSFIIKAWHQRKNAFVQCIGLGLMTSCIAIGVHSATDFNMRLSANAMLLTVIVGIAVAVVQHAKPTIRSSDG